MDKQKFKAVLKVILSILLIIITVVSLILIILFKDLYEINHAVAIITIISVIISLIIPFIFPIIWKKRESEAKQESVEYRKRLTETVNSQINNKDSNYIKANDSDKDILSLNIETHKSLFDDNMVRLLIDRMTESHVDHKLGRKQAQDSFLFSIIMGILGFFLFGFAVIFSFFYPHPVHATLFSVISGAIIEIMSSIFLFIYGKSLKQFNDFHKELKADERFFYSIALLENLSDEKKDEVLSKIISSQLK